MMSFRNFILLLFLNCFFFGFANQEKPKYLQIIDSASKYLETAPNRSKSYLELITNPSEVNLEEKIGEYYYLLAKLENEQNNPAGAIQNFIKSVKYSEQYKNYKIAAKSSAELASKFYLLKKDSLATIYFEKSKEYHTQNKDEHGLLDLMQFPAYAKYVNFEMEESIDLVLKDLEIYKNVEGDKMYYSFAIFLLTSNYLHLGNIDKAREYNSIYKSLEGNKYIEDAYYLTYENAIKSCFAEYYFEYKNLDSVKFYLDGIKIKSGSKDFNIQKNLYDYYIKYYKLKGDTEKTKMYLDSLEIFNNKILENTLNSSLDITEDLSQINIELAEEIKSKERKKKYIYVLIIGAVVLLILLFIYIKKIRKKEFLLSDLKEKFTKVKAKQEKLVIKKIELEEFLASLRGEIKRISTMESLENQKKSIKELYRNIHTNHSNFVDSDDHYKLISSINEGFFIKAEEKFPELDSLDILICYYLFSGFKNKEIAAFVGRSVRAIENKRYRITKKLELDTRKTSLKNYLDTTFKD